jgi:hypothetical protein
VQDAPDEEKVDMGYPIEPFNLRREREVHPSSACRHAQSVSCAGLLAPFPLSLEPTLRALLRARLQEGYFDEHGHYVEYRLKADLRDAWLDECAPLSLRCLIKGNLGVGAPDKENAEFRPPRVLRGMSHNADWRIFNR